MNITIQQGSEPPKIQAEVTIVIDVLRAFTVAHYAFLYGADRILMVNTVEEAFQLKGLNPDYLLAGEIEGLLIEGFDLDNSPLSVKSSFINGRTIVQKTTNGVKATLNHLGSKHIFVTGFSNARTTAEFIKAVHGKTKEEEVFIRIVASHPYGDDDLACAEYIRAILLGHDSPTPALVKQRIENCHAAKKFFDPNNWAFESEDVLISMEEVQTPFVMKVNYEGKIPMIERVSLWKILV